MVFGTVLFGRMKGGVGADRALGLFINTLPVRIRLRQRPVAEAVRGMHVQLTGLLRHEHAPLALAQRCSGISAPTPLFTALLNYRHSVTPGESTPPSILQGVEYLGGEDRTDYPVTISVDNFGGGFKLTAQVQAPNSPKRLCAYMCKALEAVVDALERLPLTPLTALDVIPPEEREQLLVGLERG